MSAAERVLAAASPADLFPANPGEARRVYRNLARVLHPDAGGDERAFRRLVQLWDQTQHPGRRASTVVLSTKRRTFAVSTEPAHRGDLADLLPATWDDDGVPATGLAKVSRSPRNNDLLQREALVLRRLQADRPTAFAPVCEASVRQRSRGGGADHQVNVLSTDPGEFVSFTDVRDAFPLGIDGRDAAWMWRRGLAALGVAHHAGIVHGAITPDHVLLEPREHGLVLVDWCYAVELGQPLTALVPRWRDQHFYPAEALAKEPVSGATDIAMLAHCMMHVMQHRAPRGLRAFANGCTLQTLSSRPHDAWALREELDELLQRLYGRRRFRPFTMPEPVTTNPV